MPLTNPLPAQSDLDRDGVVSRAVDDLSTPGRKPPQRALGPTHGVDPILTVDDVARRLNVSKDWAWDYSS